MDLDPLAVTKVEYMEYKHDGVSNEEFMYYIFNSISTYLIDIIDYHMLLG